MTPDLQEALSYAYAVKQNIVRLRSGNYAVFGRYNYSSGHMPVLHIGPWSECEAYVTEFVPPPPRERPVTKGLAHLELDLDL